MGRSLPDSVKEEILKITPDARIILYGSRSRGDYGEDSDWDFLILLDKKPDYKQIQKIRYVLYLIELEREEIISSIIRDKAEWNSPLYHATPFYQNVMKEAIII